MVKKMIEHHMRVRILPLAQPRLLYVCMYEFSYLSAHCFPIFIPLSIWPRVIKEMNYVAGRDSGTPFHCSEIYVIGVLDVAERNKRSVDSTLGYSVVVSG